MDSRSTGLVAGQLRNSLKGQEELLKVDVMMSCDVVV